MEAGTASPCGEKDGPALLPSHLNVLTGTPLPTVMRLPLMCTGYRSDLEYMQAAQKREHALHHMLVGSALQQLLQIGEYRKHTVTKADPLGAWNLWQWANIEILQKNWMWYHEEAVALMREESVGQYLLYAELQFKQDLALCRTQPQAGDICRVGHSVYARVHFHDTSRNTVICQAIPPHFWIPSLDERDATGRQFEVDANAVVVVLNAEKRANKLQLVREVYGDALGRGEYVVVRNNESAPWYNGLIVRVAAYDEARACWLVTIMHCVREKHDFNIMVDPEYTEQIEAAAGDEMSGAWCAGLGEAGVLTLDKHDAGSQLAHVKLASVLSCPKDSRLPSQAL